MANTNITCPNCQSNLEIDDGLFGNAVECPVCHQSFMIEAPAAATAAAPTGNVQNKFNDLSSKATAQFSEVMSNINGLQGKSMILAGLAVIISIIALIISLTSSGMPNLKMSKDPEKAVKNHLEYRIQFRGLDSYFWKKNGKKIIKNLSIKEVKTNGNSAVVFFKLSLDATEVKDVMFLRKSREGYWIGVNRNDIPEKEWLKNLKEKKIDNWLRDNGEFDTSDF